MRWTPAAGATESARSRCPPAVKPSGIGVTPGTPADHWAIHGLLRHVFQRPSLAEYQAQLDDPGYEPLDRLLIQRGRQIVAHLRLIHRDMRFGPLTLSTGWVAELATLPEYRCQGYASTLLAAAEQRLQDEGHALGLLRTDQPGFYGRRGWVVCGQPSSSAASPQRILSCLSERNACRYDPFAMPRQRLHIRYLRHVEKVALMRLYRDGTQGAFGASLRRESYWQWLITRRAYDHIYLAIEGSPQLELDDSLMPIVGYAVMKDGRIVEVMTAARRPDAGESMLSRACADALESDRREVRLEASPDDPLHQTVLAAGGAFRAAGPEGRPVVMARLFEPWRFLALLEQLLIARLDASGLGARCELGLVVGERSYTLRVSANGVELTLDRHGRSYVTCRPSQWVQLLLGHANVRQLVAAGRITASTQHAVDTAAVLFPQLPLWHPPLDDLPA